MDSVQIKKLTENFWPMWNHWNWDFYGHTTRKYESLEKKMAQKCVPGYRNRGRQRRRWTDDITEWTGMKKLQQRKIVIVGEEYYVPPTKDDRE